MSKEPKSWEESLTGQFGVEELAELRDAPASEIIERLRKSKGLVVIRSLYELLGHQALEKLKEVANDPEVNKLMQGALVPNFSKDAEYLIKLYFFFECTK